MLSIKQGLEKDILVDFVLYRGREDFWHVWHRERWNTQVGASKYKSDKIEQIL